MTAEDSFAENSTKDILNITGEDGYQLIINGSSHNAFTDVGLLMKHFIPLIPQHILLSATIDAKRMVNITKSFILKFFNIYLNYDPKADLYILKDEYEEVILLQNSSSKD
jgi:hypothetical protein